MKIANLERDLIVCTNKCGEGLGGFLMQDNHVLCYETGEPKEHEKNSVNHDLKLLVVVHALKMWQHYLMGKGYMLMKNHNGLKHLFD